MKLLYLCNLFIICCNAFTIQPSYNIALKSNSINKYNCNNQLSFIKNNNNHLKNNYYLKKNNYDDDIYDENITLLIVNIIYNIILYSYIYYLIISKH